MQFAQFCLFMFGLISQQKLSTSDHQILEKAFYDNTKCEKVVKEAIEKQKNASKKEEDKK